MKAFALLLALALIYLGFSGKYKDVYTAATGRQFQFPNLGSFFTPGAPPFNTSGGGGGGGTSGFG